MFPGGPEQAKALLQRHARTPVGTDIRHSCELHIVLPGHGFGDTLSDHAVAVDGDSALLRLAHRLLLTAEFARLSVSPVVSETRAEYSTYRVSCCRLDTRLDADPRLALNLSDPRSTPFSHGRRSPVSQRAGTHKTN